MADTYTSSVMWPNYSQANVEKASKKSNELGKDAFLKLMMAQMQNQDPLSPMDNTQMVAQMAQFTSVEQLTNISDQISKMGESLGNTSGLIGKEVTWISQTKTGNYDVVTGQPEVIQERDSGIVDSIVVRSGVHYVKIGARELEVSQIEQVSVPVEEETEQGVDPS
ncbi:flagellar hook assembly protein FlgD [Paenibacillus senegalimassiliensis]|uniref:flagellar hook assembly protein FlgD n=1 Tax=Paenibacillus senegalimassiliensis TaxID=1737426 RepID=UPI00073F06CB|nr:flagellar hook capping FlgD N-terminal domain-containing protein [Paenibacillus senegalimassiliensis]